MAKFFLVVAVLACASFGVHCWASAGLQKFCDGIVAKEVQEDRLITLYQNDTYPRNGIRYFWTSGGGIYRIEHSDSRDADIYPEQEKMIERMFEIAELIEQPVNLCVSQSTSPYTVKRIEVDNEPNDIQVFWE